MPCVTVCPRLLGLPIASAISPILGSFLAGVIGVKVVSSLTVKTAISVLLSQPTTKAFMTLPSRVCTKIALLGSFPDGTTW